MRSSLHEALLVRLTSVRYLLNSVLLTRILPSSDFYIRTISYACIQRCVSRWLFSFKLLSIGRQKLRELLVMRRVFVMRKWSWRLLMLRISFGFERFIPLVLPYYILLYPLNWIMMICTLRWHPLMNSLHIPIIPWRRQNIVVEHWGLTTHALIGLSLSFSCL